MSTIESPRTSDAVLVTGAATGIGRAIALRLAAAGATVFAGVRRESDGTALAATAPSGRIRPLVFDVTDMAAIEGARAAVAAAGLPLAGIVNNAGISIAGPLEVLPDAELRRQFDVNFFGAIAVTRAFLPALRASRGRVVSVGSISGKISVPMLGAYAASKFALEAACDALRVELRPSGIDVVLIEPGAVKTPIWQKSTSESGALAATLAPPALAVYGAMIEKMRAFAARAEKSAVDADRVARVVETALYAKRPRARYVVGTDARVQLVLARAPERLRDNLFAKLIGIEPAATRRGVTMFAALLPILGITFIDILGFSILIPILPYYTQHFGASYIVVGLLFATFALCQFVAGPLWGNASDRIGRKSVLIISQIGATLGWAMLAFAPTLAWVFAARVVEGVSGGNISVTQAYVADRVRPEERSQAFAYVGAAFSAGFVIGPLAGGLLLDHFGYRTPFLLAAGLQVVTLLATVFFLPEKVAEKGEAGPSASFGDIFRFLGDARVSPVLVQKLAYSLGLYAWFAVFALVIHVLLGFGPSQTSYFFAAFGLSSIVFQLLVVGRLTERLGVRVTSNIGFASACLFFLIVPFARSAAALLAAQLLFAFALSIANATLAALLTDAAPERVRGTVLGVGSSLEAVSGVAMPTVSTAILTYYGPAWTGATSAFFCFIALALGVIAQRRGTPVPE